MIEFAAKIIFYALMSLFGIYGLLMIYILLRFGRSTLLGIVLSAFYAVLILSLYAAAVASFEQIPFPQFNL